MKIQSLALFRLTRCPAGPPPTGNNPGPVSYIEDLSWQVYWWHVLGESQPACQPDEPAVVTIKKKSTRKSYIQYFTLCLHPQRSFLTLTRFSDFINSDYSKPLTALFWTNHFVEFCWKTVYLFWLPRKWLIKLPLPSVIATFLEIVFIQQYSYLIKPLKPALVQTERGERK
jgi:hypothetical protein